MIDISAVTDMISDTRMAVSKAIVLCLEGQPHGLATLYYVDREGELIVLSEIETCSTRVHFNIDGVTFFKTNRDAHIYFEIITDSAVKALN